MTVVPAAAASPRPPATRPPQNGAAAPQTSVTVWFAVRTRDGRPASSLDEHDFQVFVDGKLRKDVSIFSGGPAPLTVGLLLQYSHRRQDTLPYREMGPAMGFFQSVIRGNSRGFVATFDGKVHSLGSPTNNMRKLEQNIRKVQDEMPRGKSALYDAILQTLEKRMAARSGTHKVLVIVADGHDNHSKHGPADAIQTALQTGTQIYFVNLAYANPSLSGTARNAAIQADQKIAKETGGSVAFVLRRQDFPGAFEKIADQLQGQYALSFPLAGAECDGKFHRIEIRVPQEDVNVTAPSRIYAPKTCEPGGGN
jgi:VWFA-related protein